MTTENLFSRLRAWHRRSPSLIIRTLRGCVLSFMLIPAFGGWMLAVLLISNDKQRQSRLEANDAAQQMERPLVRRLLDPPIEQLKKACRPSSHYVPLLSSILALLYAFRAMEAQHISLPGTDDYQESCPSGSRRTIPGAFVKLFAALVTTIGVHGHLHSLNGSNSWKFELFRALELFINPLASVFNFVEMAWYGFVDLLKLSPGLWGKGTTMRYRFGRLCGCYVKSSVPSGTGLRYSIAVVGPHHLEVAVLKRDLKWGGRILVLVILFGQYVQAAILMTRRILSDTAAGLDYAVMFLIVSALSALLRSLIISLLNVSWVLNGDVQPCTEPLCNLPGCLVLKQEQGLPCKALRIMFLGHNIVLIPRTILHQLAGGFLQTSILLRLKYNLLYNVMVLWISQLAWRSTISYVAYAWSFWKILTEDDPVDSRLPALDTLDHNATDNSQSEPPGVSGPLTIFNVLTTLFLSIAGVVAIAWICLLLIWQLSWLVMPSVALYLRIATETAYWRSADTSQPCPQLWKDGLEDELWWF